MYPLTNRERAEERADLRAEDARERLRVIQESKKDCLTKIALAIDALAADANSQRSQAPAIDGLREKEAVEACKEALDDLLFRVVSDLEDMERGEGRHEPDEDDADRWHRARIDNRLTGDA